MNARSRIHMLTVAATRLEHDHANPALIKALRQAAEEAAGKRARGEGFTKEEQKRIDGQRTLMAMVTPSSGLDRLKAAMLQRAYDLMWDGDTSGCDALIEFLPSMDVDKMFDAWQSDQDPKTNPRSSFYGAA